MHVMRTDGNFLQYNDVADQFVVVWLGIVAVMVDVKHYSQPSPDRLHHCIAQSFHLFE